MKYAAVTILVALLGTAMGGGALAKTPPGLAKKDNTPPVITPVLSGTLGSNGWYISNVSLSWTVSDAQSSILASSGCMAVSQTTDTIGSSYTCTATSGGGTSSQTVTIKRDASAPTTSISSPSSGASYSQGQVVTASYSCGDSLSGVASCTGTADHGTAIDTSTAGSQTFSVTAVDVAGNRSSRNYSYSVTSTSSGSDSVAGTYLFAWNDLGMHCADSDYSVFTLLPPFNTLNAQLVVDGKLVSTGVELTYESAEDPATLSINTFSRGKTNFWEYDESLFGVSLVPDVGLTGNPTASVTPAPLAWNAETGWFEATGIPIMPIDDNYRDNPYPLVKVTARDSSGTAIASSHAVLPVSSEINCNSCHASNTSATAKPKAGWVNLTAGSEKDWRMNILRLHDEKNAASGNYVSLMGSKGYGASLESSAANGKPILCDTCHNSNALAVWGIAGVEGVSNMTAAIHNRHANVSLPGSTQTLDSISTRDACYNCHPGKNTECLRGAMGNPVDSTGKHSMECQSCHGGMSTVGNRARNGWFDMPKCQSCHHDGLRETVAIKSDGTFKDWSDTRFASNPDKPVLGTSLYRFSTGHGKLQCEACHNSTHAEFTNKPSASGNQVNDNLRAIEAQGYAAAIRECTVCHATMPSTSSGGPHGMHRLGQGWVGGHENVDKSGCAYCHGNSSAGSPLAVMKVAKTFSIGDNRSKTFAVDERVTCWSCHGGPNP